MLMKAPTDSASTLQHRRICVMSVLALATAASVGSAPLADHLQIPYASTKPYHDFESFYPFYISQHQDVTCRALHFVGTSLVIFIILMDLDIALAMMMGACSGMVTFSMTRHVKTGLFEMATCAATFLATFYYLSRSLKKALMILFLGYGFAWCGHFFFEGNRPATFIYPTLSLCGDFRLWYDLAAQKTKFDLRN